MLKSPSQQGSPLFLSLQNTYVAEYLDAIKSLLTDYEETSSWEKLKQILIQLKKKVKHDSIYRLLAYLMDQEAIKETFNILYQFLLFGRKMKKEKRVAFVSRKEEERLKLHLYTFIGLLGMEKQPEYVLYAHFFMQESQLSISMLNNYIHESHIRINVQHKIKNMKEQQKKAFNPNQILSEHEILSILNVILPLNLTQIRLLKDEYLKVQYFKQFKDMELFLFIGRTGIGKSTLILYLLGQYDFKFTTDDEGWMQLSPINLKPKHKHITTKSSSTSVTNSIHVVTTAYREKEFGLSDTPGDGDTRGTTRMFFNELVLKWETYKYFKKVKILEVVDIEEFFIGRINALSQFVKRVASSYNFTSYIDLQKKLTVIFNKCNPEQDRVTELIEKIQVLRDSPTCSPMQVEVLLFLLNQLVKRPKQEVQTVMPTNFYMHPEKRTSLLDYVFMKQTVDPEVVIKRQESRYKTSITTTEDYYYSNIKRGLFSEDYDMAYHYYLERLELLNMCPSFHLGSDIDDAIRAKTVQYCDRFNQILQQGSQKLYQEKDFKELKDIREKMKHIQIFKTHILELNEQQKVTAGKEKELIQSYKEKINHFRCSDEFINNYKQFLDIFDINEDPAQLLTISNQRILKDIDRLFANDDHLSSLDQLYNDLVTNINQILIISPNSNNNKKSYLDLRLQSIIISLFQKIKSEMDAQVLQVYRMSDLESTIETEPIQRELQVANLIKRYEKFDQSTVLCNIRVSLESSHKIVSLESLLQMLYKALFEKFKQFKKMMQSTEKTIKKDAVANFRKFMNTYMEIKYISQKMSPYYEELKEEIMRNKQISEKILEQILALFPQFINKNENMPQFAYRASKIPKQVQKVDAYLQFLQEKCKYGDFYQSLNRLIREAHQSVPNNRQLKNETIQKETFILMINKYTKIKTISEVFIQGISEIHQFIRKIQEFVECLSKKIERSIEESMRQYQFLEQLKKKTYFNSINLYGFIYQQLKLVNYKSCHMENMMKVFNQIYERCQKLVENHITFERAVTLSRHQARNQIYIQKVFHIFDFLNKIAQMSVFQNHFKEIDVRQEIISKLQIQITAISNHIEQRVRQKSFSLQDSIYRRVYDLGQIGKDTFELLDASKNKLSSCKMTELKEKYDSLMQYALKNAAQNRTYASLEVKEHDDLLQVVNKFIVLYDQQRHMPDNKKRIFNQLCDHISNLMRPYSDKPSDSLMKRHYPRLINIQNRLSKDAGVEVAQLNLFVQYLQNKIEETILQYYEDAKRMYTVHTIKEAKKSLTNIAQILQLSQFNLEKLKDTSLKDKIQALKEDILKSQQKIKSQRQIFESLSDIYENFAELVQFTINERLSDKIFKNLAAKLQQQIRLLSESSFQGRNQLLFLKKHHILNQCVFIIHADQARRQELLHRLQNVLGKQKQHIESKLKKQTETNYAFNYEGLMRACYICQKYSLGDLLQTFRQKKREYLRMLQEQIQSAGLNQDLFVLCSPFWPTQIHQVQAKIYNRFQAENMKQEKYFMDIIVSRKVLSFIERLSANRLKKQDNITVNNIFMEFINTLNKYREKFYNPDFYEEIKKQIALKMQHTSLKIVLQ